MLRVVSIRSWVADEFRDAARRSQRHRDLDVRHSLGLDIPAAASLKDAWWCPTEWAARAMPVLAAADTEIPLMAPPTGMVCQPAWARWTARAIGTCRLDEVTAAPAPPSSWWKPAEFKVEALPAAAYPDAEEFLDAATRTGLGADCVVLWSAPLEGEGAIVEEHRTFVLLGRVHATSPYLVNASSASGEVETATWSPEMGTARSAEAAAFADRALADVAAEGADLPAAFVLDVALLRDGSWVVLEANPAWSAAAYGCDLANVLDVVLAASDPRWLADHPAHRWQPDPYLVRRAAQQRPLRLG